MGYPRRDTTPVGVKAVEDYTFDEMLVHLHDYHGLNAEDQAEDEEFNQTEPEVIDRIRNMTRQEAIERLPYHYFQSYDSPDSLASAVQKHREEHDSAPDTGGYGKVHFHPGKFKEA